MWHILQYERYKYFVFLCGLRVLCVSRSFYAKLAKFAEKGSSIKPSVGCTAFFQIKNSFIKSSMFAVEHGVDVRDFDI